MSSLMLERLDTVPIIEVVGGPALRDPELVAAQELTVFEDTVALGRIVSAARSLQKMPEESIYARLPLSSFHLCDGMPQEVRDATFGRFRFMSNRLRFFDIGEPQNDQLNITYPDNSRTITIQSLKKLGHYTLVEETKREIVGSPSLTYTFAFYPVSFISTVRQALAA
jgi:hypothetical protein